MRTLYYVPVVHTPEELGSLAKPILELEKKIHGPQAEENYRRKINQIWLEILRRLKERKLNTPKTCQKLHIYIDGLAAQFYCCKVCLKESGQKQYMDEVEIDKIRCPSCGRTVEAPTREPLLKMVEELIEKQLTPYLIIEKLMKRGAKIHGTESPKWLLKEHERNLKMARGIPSSPREGEEILKKRDEFIAQRINETLPQSEIGLLFLGRGHRADERIKKFSDIKVIYL